jgi:hypothetical protein
MIRYFAQVIGCITYIKWKIYVEKFILSPVLPQKPLKKMTKQTNYPEISMRIPNRY